MDSDAKLFTIPCQPLTNLSFDIQLNLSFFAHIYKNLLKSTFVCWYKLDKKFSFQTLKLHQNQALQDSHLAEWQNSFVTRELTKLNVFSRSELSVYDCHRYALPEKDRRNDGRLRDKIFKRKKVSRLNTIFRLYLLLINQSNSKKVFRA